jgi:hypothetical protein
MAQRRMFNQTVVDSDAFLDLPPTAQNLYFHLGLRADDEGFIDNVKTVKRLVSAKDDDLQILLDKRYLLEFESGVVVIKHWKIHNTIRKDRMNPTLYVEEKNLIVEKKNGIYTERNKSIDSKELGNDSIDAATNTQSCTPSIEENSIDYNRIVENKGEESINWSQRFEEYKKIWTDNGLPPYTPTFLNIPNFSEVANRMAMYEKAAVSNSIENYAKLLPNNPSPFQTFINFLMKDGVDKFRSESHPEKRYNIDTPNENVDYREGYDG